MEKMAATSLQTDAAACKISFVAASLLTAPKSYMGWPSWTTKRLGFYSDT
jgi:hypothetical protein